MSARRLTAALCLGMALALGSAVARPVPANAPSAAGLPVPPCAGAPVPDYPAAGRPADIRVWFNEEVAGWRPADCAELKPVEANAVIAVAARFANTLGADAIAGRVARVSNYRLLRYHSKYRNRWRPMVKDAFAVSDTPDAHAPPQKSRRGDFTEADLAAGRAIRYWVKDNSLMGGVIYRLTVRERTEERFVYEVENETALTFLTIDAVAPGQFRQLHVFERDGGAPDGWRYYALVVGRIKWFRPSPHSFISRAAAYFHHVTGAPDEPTLLSAD